MYFWNRSSKCYRRTIYRLQYTSAYAIKIVSSIKLFPVADLGDLGDFALPSGMFTSRDG